MSNYTTTGELLQVSSKLIFSDPNYQRRLDMQRVREIANNFDPNLVNPVKVSYRSHENRYYVFDGQHTLAALRMRHKGRDFLVDCRVWQSLTPEEEARLFARQNGISRGVTINAKLKALYYAGDPVVKDFYEATNAIAPMDFTSCKRKGVRACAKAYSIFTSVGREEYTTILTILKEAWDGEEYSFNAELLGGMKLFHFAYKGEYKRKILIAKLGKISPLTIIRDGKVSSEAGDAKYARQILRAYNKSLRTPLPDKL